MSTSSRVRGNNIPINNLVCPICNNVASSEGWLKWHVKKYHPDYDYVSKAASARGVKMNEGWSKNLAYRCRHIGIQCRGPQGKPPAECKGLGECIMEEYHPYLRECFNRD